jgi:hypothetical protein
MAYYEYFEKLETNKLNNEKEGLYLEEEQLLDLLKSDPSNIGLIEYCRIESSKNKVFFKKINNISGVGIDFLKYMSNDLKNDKDFFRYMIQYNVTYKKEFASMLNYFDFGENKVFQSDKEIIYELLLIEPLLYIENKKIYSGQIKEKEFLNDKNRKYLIKDWKLDLRIEKIIVSNKIDLLCIYEEKELIENKALLIELLELEKDYENGNYVFSDYIHKSMLVSPSFQENEYESGITNNLFFQKVVNIIKNKKYLIKELEKKGCLGIDVIDYILRNQGYTEYEKRKMICNIPSYTKRNYFLELNKYKIRGNGIIGDTSKIYNNPKQSKKEEDVRKDFLINYYKKKEIFYLQDEIEENFKIKNKKRDEFKKLDFFEQKILKEDEVDIFKEKINIIDLYRKENESYLFGEKNSSTFNKITKETQSFFLELKKEKLENEEKDKKEKERIARYKEVLEKEMKTAIYYNPAKKQNEDYMLPLNNLSLKNNKYINKLKEIIIEKQLMNNNLDISNFLLQEICMEPHFLGIKEEKIQVFFAIMRYNLLSITDMKKMIDIYMELNPNDFNNKDRLKFKDYYSNNNLSLKEYLSMYFNKTFEETIKKYKDKKEKVFEKEEDYNKVDYNIIRNNESYQVSIYKAKTIKKTMEEVDLKKGLIKDWIKTKEKNNNFSMLFNSIEEVPLYRLNNEYFKLNDFKDIGLEKEKYTLEELLNGNFIFVEIMENMELVCDCNSKDFFEYFKKYLIDHKKIYKEDDNIDLYIELFHEVIPMMNVEKVLKNGFNKEYLYKYLNEYLSNDQKEKIEKIDFLNNISNNKINVNEYVEPNYIELLKYDNKEEITKSIDFLQKEMTKINNLKYSFDIKEIMGLMHDEEKEKISLEKKVSVLVENMQKYSKCNEYKKKDLEHGKYLCDRLKIEILDSINYDTIVLNKHIENTKKIKLYKVYVENIQKELVKALSEYNEEKMNEDLLIDKRNIGTVIEKNKFIFNKEKVEKMNLGMINLINILDTQILHSSSIELDYNRNILNAEDTINNVYNIFEIGINNYLIYKNDNANSNEIEIKDVLKIKEEMNKHNLIEKIKNGINKFVVNIKYNNKEDISYLKELVVEKDEKKENKKNNEYKKK